MVKKVFFVLCVNFVIGDIKSIDESFKFFQDSSVSVIIGGVNIAMVVLVRLFSSATRNGNRASVSLLFSSSTPVHPR